MIHWAHKARRTEVLAGCAKYNLDPDLVVAMVSHESNGNPLVTRFEPEAYARGRYNVDTQGYASHLGITEVTERVAQYHSYGLFQIMGFKLREMGYKNYLVQALDPLDNAMYGCLIIKKLFEKYSTEEEVVAAYNMGSPRRTAGGLFENQKNYVDPIFKKVRELRC